jgi:hypothetical protein
VVGELDDLVRSEGFSPGEETCAGRGWEKNG